MLNAGKVAPVPKGNWNSTTTYYALDIVNHGGSSWIAKIENLNHEPAEGQYWMRFGTSVPIATTSVAGIVIPDGTTITVDEYGHIASVFSADLDDLDNVSITSPSNNQVLKYNATSQKWENGTDTGGLIPHLIIISETGSTVTVSKGAWSTTATETSTGHFECDVPEFGTYTIDAVLDGDDAQVSLVVDAVKIYTVDDSHFHADITVTFPSGSTCSCGKAGETPTYATTSPHTFTVHSTGVYTVSATDGSSTATDTVTITTSGQTESVTLSFVPNGSTVVPTDDIQTWLHCGNIWDKAYTTLAELLADSTTLLAVTSSNNAVDYLVRSKSFINKGLVPVMTSATTPSGKVTESSNYSGLSVPYKTFDDDWNKSAEMPDQLGWVSHAAGDTNEYLAYEFDTPQKIMAIKIRGGMERYGTGVRYCALKTFKVQYSDNGTSWEDADNAFTFQATTGVVCDAQIFTLANDVGTHKHWRIFVIDGYSTETPLGIANLQFYPQDANITDNSTAMTDIGANNYCANTLLADSDWCEGICNSTYFESVLNVKVPTMTSNTTPSGEVSASSEYVDHNIGSAWNGFDGNVGTYWRSHGNADGWLRYDFTRAVRILKVFCKSAAFNSHTFIKYIKLQGSNDGNTWIDLTSQITTTDNVADNTFNVDNSNTYSKYRMYCSGSYYGQDIRINILQLYGREDV